MQPRRVRARSPYEPAAHEVNDGGCPGAGLVMDPGKPTPANVAAAVKVEHIEQYCSAIDLAVHRDFRRLVSGRRSEWLRD
jgi:hypothetical protein